MKLVHTIWRVAALVLVALLTACTGGTPDYDCGNVTVTTLAGTGSAGSADNTTGTLASLNTPNGVTSDGTNLYVVDTGNHKIRKIVIATGAVSTFAGTGSAGSADNNTGTLASFNSPSGITSDGTNLYVADTNNHKIRQIVIATGVVSTLAGTGSAGSADNTGTLASFDSPSGITSDGTNLYVLDASRHRIRKIVIATGAVTTLAQNPLAALTGLVVHGTTLYAPDYLTGFVYTVSTATGTVDTLSVSGNLPQYPVAIATDGRNLYLTGVFQQTTHIYKIVIDSGVTTALSADFTYPLYGMVTVAASTEGVNLYVTSANQEVLKVNYVPGVCAAQNSHLVTGTVSGLGASKSLILRNNNETKPVTSNGVFSFNTSVAEGQAYDVRVSQPPTGQGCTVANGSGTVSSSNIDNVVVTCSNSSPSAYTVGGTAIGLSGTVVLQNNGGGNLSITADGSFTFASPVTTGGVYNVTVLTQPTGQTCTVSSGSGTVGAANVTNVAVSCAANTYFISGIVNNQLTLGLVLQNNGGDDLSTLPSAPPLTTSMPFTFVTPVPYNSSYDISVLTSPSGQTCTVTSGGGGPGSRVTGNVTDVVIDCTP